MLLTQNNPTAPPYADFPPEEYQRRTAWAQELMRQEGLDLLVMTQRENVEYFSGLLTGHWPIRTFACGAVLIPATGEPVLIVPDFFEGTASRSSWMARRVHFTEPHAQPRGFARQVVATITDLKCATGAIGLEAGENLTSGWNLLDYHHMRDTLFSADFRSGANVIWGCRTIKSDLEIERMRFITAVTDDALQYAKSRLAIGVTEEDIAGWVIERGSQRGADGPAFMNIRAGLPRYPCADSLPVARPIEPGEMLLMDVGLRRHTYSTDVAYVAHVGKPLDQHRSMYDAVVRAHEAVLAATRPGATSNELFHAGHKVLQDYGYGKTLDMMGHGIGLDVHEPPILTPYDSKVLEPGMVFAIEPWLYDVEKYGFFCVEEIVRVTEDGYEILSSLPRDELWTVNE
ncbi:M24 family metallopeptidase [Micromonospora sp. NPDC048830]|uniref:M24 family metallopeptidase n=1 Tax=Micromonospora sp. NPDC048830 TaxID=3364257 RepID=UPI003722C975